MTAWRVHAVELSRCWRSEREEGPGQKHDHDQCLPKWLLALTFAQVKALPPKVCKTVGPSWSADSRPGPQSEMRIRAVISSPEQAEAYGETSMIVNWSRR